MGQAQTLEGHTDFLEDLAVSPDGLRAVSASRDQTLRVWDLEAGRTIATFTAESQLWSCALASDGITALAGDVMGQVHFLQYAPGR